MTIETTLGAITLLPLPPAGWFDHAYALLWNGDLALVRAEQDFRAAHKIWRDQVQSGNLQARPANSHSGRLRVSTFDGSVESEAIELSAGLWPGVQRLPDGRWMVVARRADHEEKNAQFFAADGTPIGGFAMGDGINHIRCAEDGTIWVGYFDEGIVSATKKDGSRPISSFGIVRFAPDGGVLWKFDWQEHPDISIDDCYALTLDGNTIWSCPYADFPIIRIERGVVSYWRNEVSGASALAVDDDHVLLAGGYNENADRIALLRLGTDRAEQIGEWHYSPLRRNAARLLQGQGGALHIVEDGRWIRIRLATLKEKY